MQVSGKLKLFTVVKKSLLIQIIKNKHGAILYAIYAFNERL